MKSGVTRREVLMAGGALAVAGVIPARALARVGASSLRSGLAISLVTCHEECIERAVVAGEWLNPGDPEIRQCERCVVWDLNDGRRGEIEGVWGGRAFVAGERVRVRVLGACRPAGSSKNVSVDVLHPFGAGHRAQAVMRGRESSPVELKVRAFENGVRLRVMEQELALGRSGLFLVSPGAGFDREPRAALRWMESRQMVHLIPLSGTRLPDFTLVVSVRGEGEERKVSHAG